MPKSRKRWLVTALSAGLLVILVAAILTVFAPQSIVNLLRRDLTWQTIQADGLWRVGMDPSFPPFEWLDDNGKPVGYDVELTERIAAHWGLRVEIVPIGFDSLVDAVQTGRVDSVVSALPYDERLTRNLAYSPPYFDAGLALATRTDSLIQSVDDLVGETIAVEWGSLGDMIGRRLQQEEPTITLVRFETPADTIAALTNPDSVDIRSEVDAILIDHVTLRVAQVNGVPLVQVGPLLENNPYVIAMPIRAHELQAALQKVLAKFQAEGVLAELETKWFVDVE